MLEAETVFEMFEIKSIFTWLVTGEDFTENKSTYTTRQELAVQFCTLYDEKHWARK
jgi:hypothetical protein